MGCAVLALANCDATPDDARTAWVAETLSKADEPLIRTRPQLVEGKYVRMRGSLYDFYRGNFALFLRDASEGGLVSQSAYGQSTGLPIALGDAHPENFGLLEAGDGTLALEPNDFDGADRYPFLWDLRRLTTGLVIASRLSNVDDPSANQLARQAERDIAGAAASAYAQSITALSKGQPSVGRIEDGAASAVIADLFDRGLDDLASREELDELTVVQQEKRALKRGAIEPDDPNHVYVELPEVVMDALPDVLERYRQTLIAPPPADDFRILDAVREYGSGVASWPRLRVVILVRGPTNDLEDDVILELKELGDSGAGGFAPPGVFFDSVPERVRATSRLLWARPDAERLWGTTTMLGLPIQVRREAEAHKNVRIARLEEELGTPEALIDLAATLGALLARMHGASQPRFEGTTAAIAGAIGGDIEGFAEEQADNASAYADLVEQDWQRFKQILIEQGPRLGIPLDPRDRSTPDLASLWGTPPPFQDPQ